MKILIRRDQTTGGIFRRTTIFTMSVRAELSRAESDNLKRYGLGNTVLVTTNDGVNLTVNDLVHGRKLASQDGPQLLLLERELRKAATSFAAMLGATTQFSGEERVEL